MSGLEIPDRAYAAGTRAFSGATNYAGEEADIARAIIDAAGLIIEATALRQIHDALTTIRNQEIALAEDVATKLDRVKPPAGDQRHQILTDMKGRIDGLRIAIDMLFKRITEIDPSQAVDL